MKRAVTVVLALSMNSNCERQPAGPGSSLLQPQKVGAGDNSATFDGAHNDGNRHFFFLPPLVENPSSDNGAFDASLAPVVQICEWTGTDCRLPSVAEFTTRQVLGSEAVRVDGQEEHYIVNWHTGRFDLDPTKTYRVRVLVTELIELGHIDVALAPRVGLTSRNATNQALIISGTRTIPIKFRINVGALPKAVQAVSGDSQIGFESHTLANPLVAKVTNENGEPLPGVFVSFRVRAGGGTVAPGVAFSSPSGEATATLTLGNEAVNAVHASVGDLEPATFTALASVMSPPIDASVLHVSAGDPAFATLPAGDGELLQIFGERDPEGIPIRIVGIKKFDAASPDSADILLLDGEGLPRTVALREGSVVFFNFRGNEQLLLSVVKVGDVIRQTVMNLGDVRSSQVDRSERLLDLALASPWSLQMVQEVGNRNWRGLTTLIALSAHLCQLARLAALVARPTGADKTNLPRAAKVSSPHSALPDGLSAFAVEVRLVNENGEPVLEDFPPGGSFTLLSPDPNYSVTSPLVFKNVGGGRWLAGFKLPALQPDIPGVPTLETVARICGAFNERANATCSDEAALALAALNVLCVVLGPAAEICITAIEYLGRTCDANSACERFRHNLALIPGFYTDVRIDVTAPPYIGPLILDVVLDPTVRLRTCTPEAGSQTLRGAPPPSQVVQFSFRCDDSLGDQDNDGVANAFDRCRADPGPPDNQGCPTVKDTDDDGVPDGSDQCPNTPKGALVDARGCPTDSDGDGVLDGIDECPSTPRGATVDAVGCPSDSDRDGVFYGIDLCPDTPLGTPVDEFGCPLAVDRVVVSPDPQRLVVRATASLRAIAFDPLGNVIRNLDFLWQSADPFVRLRPIAGVTDQIIVEGVSTGLARVTATTQGVSGFATVVVQPFEGRWTGSRTIAGSGSSDTRQLVCGLSGGLFDFRVSCNEPGGRLVVFSIIATNLTAYISDVALEPNQICLAPVNLSGATMSGSGRCTAGQTVDYSLTRSPE